MFIVWAAKFTVRGAYLQGNSTLSEPPLSVPLKISTTLASLGYGAAKACGVAVMVKCSYQQKIKHHTKRWTISSFPFENRPTVLSQTEGFSFGLIHQNGE